MPIISHCCTARTSETSVKQVPEIALKQFSLGRRKFGASGAGGREIHTAIRRVSLWAWRVSGPDRGILRGSGNYIKSAGDHCGIALPGDFREMGKTNKKPGATGQAGHGVG